VDACGRGRSGVCRRPHRELKNLRFTCENKNFFMKRLKKVIRNFSGRIPKIWKISKKRGLFSDSMWMSRRGRGVRLMWTHVDRGRGSKTRFSCGRHKWMGPYGTILMMAKKPRSTHTSWRLNIFKISNNTGQQ